MMRHEVTGNRRSNVSAVVCTYNHGPYIARALRSVLDQTCPPLEVIVVDDGSTDGTAGIVRGEFGDRVRYIWQENRGPSAARNAGIDTARGEWVAFLDADDCWRLDKLQRQLDAAYNRPDVALVACNGYEMAPDGQRLRLLEVPRPFDRIAIVRHLRQRCIFTLTGVMIRRTVLEALAGFPEDLRCGEDHVLWSRIAAAHNIAVVPEPLYEKTTLPSGLTGNPRLIQRDGVIARRRVHTALAQSAPRPRVSSAVTLRYHEARAYASAAEQWALRGDLAEMLHTLGLMASLWPLWPARAYVLWAWLLTRPILGRRAMRA